MLRTNSKKAVENIRNYIIDGFNGENYEPKFDYIQQAIKDTESGKRNVNIFSLIAHAIDQTFFDEILKHDLRYKAGKITRQDAFIDWCTGLPSIIDTCYFYNRSAIDDLGAILEETEEEKSKYTEAQAEQLLTKLIYREIQKATERK